MSKQKEKQKITLNEVEAIVAEDIAFLQHLVLFSGHTLAKAIKKGLLELDAINLLYANSDDWDVRRYILTISDYSIKDAAVSGLLKSSYKQGGLNELFALANGIGFETGLEFVEYVKTKFDIDLTVQPVGYYYYDIDIDEEFIAFALAFTGYYGPDNLLGDSNPNAETNKLFYKDAFLYLLRLSQYRETLRNSHTKLEDVLVKSLLERMGQVGAIDYPVFKEYLEREVKNIPARLKILMTAVNSGYRAFGSARNPFDSFNTFLEAIKYIKEISSSAKFPFVLNCCSDSVQSIFVNNLFKLGTNMYNKYSSDRKIRLTEEQKAVLFTEIYEPILYNAHILDRVRMDSNRTLHLFQSILNTAPLTERDNIYRYIKDMGYNSTLTKVIIKLCSNSTLNFYPTELMTEQLIDGRADWSSMAIPKERLYDLEYIDNIANRIGCDGILFGKKFNENEFFINVIDLDKLPKEFFDKYNSDIDWDVICRCENLGISFMKEHKEKMGFDTISEKTAALIDDELADWLLNYSVAREGYPLNVEMENRRYIAKHAGNLSISFLAKNLEKLVRIESPFKNRVMKVATPNVTLKALLKELS